MASLNPVKHYKLPVGLLLEGDPADFIRVSNLRDFGVIEVYVNGNLVASQGKSLLPVPEPRILNNFDTQPVQASQLTCSLPPEARKIKIIKVNEGQLVTDLLTLSPFLDGQEIITDTEHDVLKLVVYNRYRQTPPSIGFIHGFGLKSGAIASSVAHDSHNIIAVGVTDEDLSQAINLVVREKGGISAVSSDKMGVLPLPIAGLMSDKPVEEVARDYKQIDAFAKEILGSKLVSPYMSLSFMALLVIPSLKLSDLGLFDGNTFEFTELFN